jgi:hypothetical protein
MYAEFMRMPSHLLFMILLLLIISEKAIAQEKTPPNKQIWMDFDPSYNLNSKIVLSGRFDVRTIFPKAGISLLQVQVSHINTNLFGIKKQKNNFMQESVFFIR